MAANLDLEKLDFVDIKSLPSVIVHGTDGDHTVTYERHHVIANKTFKESAISSSAAERRSMGPSQI
ncbi:MULTISPECIES: hypothetical protein [unclassified Pseudomonas]|uniref:hypothetical protein n=1 Tax=unclassified Pseudomonas TaxID=196821 RepID=UPI002E800677|nr:MULTISPECIES: hypothetical protein [unclassified Pseudomonas]